MFVFFLKKEISRLKALIKKLEESKNIKKMPVVSKIKKREREYYIETRSVNGRRKISYLGTSSSPKVKEITKTSARCALLDIARHDIEVLEKLVTDYTPTTADSVAKRISPCLQGSYYGLELDETYERLKDWAAQKYEKNRAKLPERCSRAKDGTIVRSKGECMLYNALLDAGVPFRYDPILHYVDKTSPVADYQVTVSPDFLIKCLDGKEIIIEHVGFLQNDRYAADLMKKIQIYQQYGFILGDNLILTSDTFEGGTDSEMLQNIVNDITYKVFRE